ATVVTKLFNIVTPDQAFFGLKDYQQLQIIRKLVADLCLPISLVGIPTQRESGGLAMSSRNAYMTPEEKQRASHIYRVLREITAAISAGARDYSSLEQDAKEQLEQAALQVDYFNICHAHTLLPATEYDHELVILAAAWIGKTRLIDNITAKIT
ncbi:MAG: pantoate--beta-alanine ligase, partial [Pseudohongiellaceae bacterium]